MAIFQPRLCLIMTALYRFTAKKVAHITLSNPPVNAMGLAVREAVVAGLKRANEDGARAVVLGGDNGLFSGGADIMEFTRGTFLARPHLHDVIFGVESMKMPVTSFLQGPTMGGGLELALASHYRVASEDCIMGLPEVHLGILPGAGGTQRLPRLVGCDAAFDIMATGRHVKAIEALNMGLVDRILTTGAARDGDGGQAHFEEELEDFVLSSAVQSADLTSRTVSQRIVSGGPMSAAAVAKTQAHSFGGFVAPSIIHLAVDASTRMSFEKGLEYEFKLFESLMKGPQARAMQYLFFAGRKYQKRLKAGEVSPDIAQRVTEVATAAMAEAVAGGDVSREQVEAALAAKLGLGKVLFDQVSAAAVPYSGVGQAAVSSNSDSDSGKCTVSDADIVERVLYPMVNECYRILDEGITSKPDDVDMTCVHALGFPTHTGGPLWWAEKGVGAASVFEGLKKHGGEDADSRAKHWVPTTLLKDVAASSSNVREELYFRSQQ